ncbi:MAG: TrkH family potassium uptake protein [Clostridiales bacterium]|nr:TrkH family potassium uptake protein [Clostridiales bacterium]
MRAESPGPSVGKLVPKIKQTARLLYGVYFGLTLAEFLFLIIGGMPLFDSINVAIATAGTGGFAIKNASIGAYSIYSQWVVAIFMVLFGVNFNAYYYILLKQFRKALHMEEVRAYLITYFTAVLIIFISLFVKFGNAFQSLTDSVFQVATLMSSTGFATADFELWPNAAKMVLLCIMFMGACAGSTGGGMKVSRLLILAKTIKKEVGSYIHPKSVKKIKIEGKPVEHDVIRSVNVFFATYMLIMAFSAFLLSFNPGTDMLTCITASVSALSNMGPGFSLVGPSCNYGFFSVFSKFVIMFDMLAGRLELFPMLILFHPKLWKGLLPSKKPRKQTAPVTKSQTAVKSVSR